MSGDLAVRPALAADQDWLRSLHHQAYEELSGRLYDARAQAWEAGFFAARIAHPVDVFIDVDRTNTDAVRLNDPGHSAAEGALAESGVPHAIMRNALYADAFAERAITQAWRDGVPGQGSRHEGALDDQFQGVSVVVGGE